MIYFTDTFEKALRIQNKAIAHASLSSTDDEARLNNKRKRYANKKYGISDSESESESG